MSRLFPQSSPSFAGVFKDASVDPRSWLSAHDPLRESFKEKKNVAKWKSQPQLHLHLQMLGKNKEDLPVEMCT